MNDNQKFSLAKVGVLGFIALIVLFCSFVQVPTGYVGVVTCFGKMSDTPLPNGLDGIYPWCTATVIHTQPKNYNKEGKDAVLAETKDLQQVTIPVSVPYAINEGTAPKFYVAMGDEQNFLETVLEPAIQETIKAASAKFSSEEMINKREQLRLAFQEDLINFVDTVLTAKGVPSSVTIKDVTINDVGFVEPTFQDAINAKIRAGVLVEKAGFAAQQTVTEAEGKAFDIKNSADAEAFAIKAQAEQEANAIIREGEALKANPELVRLTAIEKWKKHLPRVVGQTVPYMAVAPKADAAPAEQPQN